MKTNRKNENQRQFKGRTIRKLMGGGGGGGGGGRSTKKNSRKGKFNLKKFLQVPSLSEVNLVLRVTTKSSAFAN